MTLNPGVFIRQRIQRWAKARNKSGNPQHLTSRNVYIFPSAFGWAYGIVLISISTGAVNYQLNPAFIFTFVLMIIALLSMWETHRNLKGLSILCLAIEDTQQHCSAKVHLMLSCDKPIRFGLNFCLEDGEPVRVEQLVQGAQVTLHIPTEQRGLFKLPALKIYSYFPFGLFRTWSYVYFNMEYYVYPQGISAGYWPENYGNQSQQQHSAHLSGDDELYELKSVASPWAQASHIAWKISARGQGWYLKTMTVLRGENWIFRIEDLASGDIELNLQQLSYWIQTAEQEGHLYGLELKGERIEISHGKHHMAYCLRQLATY